MKLKQIIKKKKKNINEPIEQRIGFRANEQKRAKSMLQRADEDGFLYEKFIVGKNKKYKKWKSFKYQKPSFPLIQDSIFRDDIEKY